MKVVFNSFNLFFRMHTPKTGDKDTEMEVTPNFHKLKLYSLIKYWLLWRETIITVGAEPFSALIPMHDLT